MGGGVFSEWQCERMTRFSFWGYFIGPFEFYVIYYLLIGDTIVRNNLCIFALLLIVTQFI